MAELSLDPAKGGRLACRRDQSVSAGARAKRQRAIAAPALKKAFADEFGREAAAQKEAREAAALFRRKRHEERQAEYEAWKKLQWQKKQGAFEAMMADRKAGAPGRAGPGLELAKYVGAAGTAPAADGYKKGGGGGSRAGSGPKSPDPGAAVVAVPPPEPEPTLPPQPEKKGKKRSRRDPKAEMMKTLLQAESQGFIKR